MRRYLSVLPALVAGGIAFMGAAQAFFLESSSAPYPTSISLSLATQTGCQGGCSAGQVPDNLAAGAPIATATVTMSDGSVCSDPVNACPLTSSNPSLFGISGFSIITARQLTPSDDGSKMATISTL